MTFLVRSSLFVVWISSLAMVFAFGCENTGTARKPTTAQQVQQLTAQKTDLQNQLEQTKTENDRLKKQAESLSKLPGDKRADAIYNLKSIKIGRYTNFYDEDKTPGADDTMEAVERQKLVREALRHVDERYREVMHLVYVEGLKVDETARILGAPEGTVKTRLMRGRAALRKILERRNPEHFPS